MRIVSEINLIECTFFMIISAHSEDKRNKDRHTGVTGFSPDWTFLQIVTVDLSSHDGVT